MRIREIAQTRVRYGYRIIRVLLNHEGWKVGQGLVCRLYKEEGLGLRKRPAGKRRAAVHRQAWSARHSFKTLWFDLRDCLVFENALGASATSQSSSITGANIQRPVEPVQTLKCEGDDHGNCPISGRAAPITRLLGRWRNRGGASRSVSLRSRSKPEWETEAERVCQ